jgi:aminomethyltransferase
MTNRPYIALGSRLRPSPFYEATRRWGAKAFTVYNHTLMPTVYDSAEADYARITNGVTLWDVAGERQVEIRGPDAFAFTQYLTPRDLSSCAPGKCRYVLMTNQHGGVINDPVLLRLKENRFWLSAADADILLWCQGVALNSGFDVKLTRPDVSPLQLQGPNAPALAATLFGDWTSDLRYFHLRAFEYEGVPLVISRTGWSGELGFEIYLCDGSRGDWLWERIMELGAPYGIHPAAPSAIRRLEGGLLSYGADADMNDTPFHLGLGRLAQVNGDFDFIGKAALLAMYDKPLSRRLTGVVLTGEPLSAPSIRWWDVLASGKRIGKVRSAVYSPSLQQNIGMAMLDAPHDVANSSFSVLTEHGSTREGMAHELPFIVSKKP